MAEYEQALDVAQAEGQLNKEPSAYVSMTNGIPNSALLGVLQGNRKASGEMMGHKRNLAPSIAAKMSQAFGMDLTGMQFYQSDAMAGTGMKGISQGNKVVLSSEVNLNSGEGQAVLGHELSHIHAQSQGVGMGHSGLYNNAALEAKADREGIMAARGLPIYGDSTFENPGMSYGLGMKGVEGLTPISGGLSASAGAPMQAKKTKPIVDNENQQGAEDFAPVIQRRPQGNNNAAGLLPRNAPDENGRENVIVDEDELDEQMANVPVNQQPQNNPIEDIAEQDQPEQQNVPEQQNEPEQQNVPEQQQEPQNIPREEERNDGVDPDLQKTVPLAWEHQSGGDPREQPKLHIFMQQNKRGDNTYKEGSANNSHGFMGLEYTRSSRIRGGAKRFRATFGYYYKGKANGIAAFGQGALCPGQLKDDTGHGADVSRSYPISYRQLNAMARFASTYENGGYNPVTRNCTTFVADTVAAGGVNVGNILQNEDWTVGAGKRMILGGAKLAGVFAPNDSGADEYRSRMNRKDLRYGVNKNLYTQEEIDRFIGSHRIGGVSLHGYNPAGTGERMRTEKIGGLSGSAEEADLTQQLDSITEEATKAELQRSIERQKQISGENWNNSGESILDAVNGLDIVIGNYKRCVVPEDSPMRVDETERQQLYREFETNAQRILNDMDTWFFRYGTMFKAIAQTAMDIYGRISLMDSMFSDEIRTLDFRPEDETKRKSDVPTEKLRSEAERRIVRQRGISAGNFDEAAGSRLISCLGTFEQLIPLREEFFEAKKIKGLALEKENEFANFKAQYDTLNGELTAWTREYGNTYPLLAQSVMDISAYLDRVFSEVQIRMSAPGAEQEKTQATNRAFSGMTANNGDVIKNYAEKKAFGGGTTAKRRMTRMRELRFSEIRRGGLSPLENNEMKKLLMEKGNKPYYVTQTLDKLDERMERYEAGGVTENDLEESFVDTPLTESYGNNKEISVRPMKQYSGGFGSFSQSLQSADLQMLFTEKPALDCLKSDESLRIWKQDDPLAKEGPERKNGVKQLTDGVDAVTEKVIDDCADKVRMLIRTMDKIDYDNERPGNDELALKTYNTITQMYSVPVLNGLLSEFDTREDKISSAADQLHFQSDRYRSDMQRAKRDNRPFENTAGMNQRILDKLKEYVAQVRAGGNAP